MIYEPGQKVQLIADIYPANIWPLPPGVPANSSYKFRILVTERAITIGWALGTGVQRVDVEVPPEDVSTSMNFRGGQAGGYTVSERSGCSICGARMIRSWHPFPELSLIVKAPN